MQSLDPARLVGQPMGSTVTGQEDADFETTPEGLPRTRLWSLSF